jgi:hypothetical protein
LNFLACYEELREHFPAEVVDHSYDDVCRVVRKTVELFREIGSVEGKTGSGRPNRTVEGVQSCPKTQASADNYEFYSCI